LAGAGGLPKLAKLTSIAAVCRPQKDASLKSRCLVADFRLLADFQLKFACPQGEMNGD
jgi:hypothetical protein